MSLNVGIRALYTAEYRLHLEAVCAVLYSVKIREIGVGGRLILPRLCFGSSVINDVGVRPFHRLPLCADTVCFVRQRNNRLFVGYFYRPLLILIKDFLLEKLPMYILNVQTHNYLRLLLYLRYYF